MVLIETLAVVARQLNQIVPGQPVGAYLHAVIARLVDVTELPLPEVQDNV